MNNRWSKTLVIVNNRWSKALALVNNRWSKALVAQTGGVSPSPSELQVE